MWQLGWVASNNGNVSVKLENGNFPRKHRPALPYARRL
ncbi:class II aldolase/adducin family protein [Treponema sp. OMZ 305]|nr:class II aldolase/adducin family protein [Treponema sp. OMZ 305]